MMDISVTQDSITRLQKLKDMLTGVSFGSANYETAYSELQDWIRYTTPGKDIDKALLRLEELYQRDKDNFTSSDSKSSFQSHLMEIVLADLEKKQASLKAYQDRTVSKDQSSLHSVLSGNHPGVTIHDNSVYLNGKDTYEGYDELLYLYLQTFGGESLRDVSGGILRILIMTGNRYATFHCTLDNFGIWSELLNILDEDSEAINSLLLKCYVHQIRVATIKWVIDRAELLKYRLWEGIAQCLATTFETTQNINYIEYVWDAYSNLTPEDRLEFVRYILSEENDSYIAVACVVTNEVLKVRSRRTLHEIRNLVIGMQDFDERQIVAALHLFIDKCAWKLSGAGPIPVDPDDRLNEQRMQEEHRNRIKEFKDRIWGVLPDTFLPM